MKKLLTVLTLLLCCVSITWADQAFRNARYDGFKVLSPDNGSIVMIGNSITDMHIWQEVFRDKDGNPLKICNRGNSGSFATEQSENLESYLANKPKKVFMMIGTNDIATSGGLSTPSTPEVLLSYVKSIVTRIHKRSSETQIYLYPILKNNTSNRVEATWTSYNTLLKNWVTETNASWLTFVDFYDKMAVVADGGAYSNDKLHPNAAAFKIWAHEICQYLGDGVTSVYDNIDGDLTSVQNQGGMSSMHGARGSMFSVMPTTANDIVVLGGEGEIKTGEWWELLGNTNVKNRGTGWGYGGTIALTSQVLDAMYAETGASKTASPRAFFLYAGTNDVATSSANVTTAETAYKALVDKIFEKAPGTKIYVMGIHPAVTTGPNVNVSAFNTWLKETLPGNYTDGKVKYVDTYTGLLNTSGTANTTYINTNNYLYGKGYAYFARQMAAAYNADFSDNQLTAPTEDEANARYTLATNRNTIGTVITANRDLTASTAVGGYTQTVVDAYNTELANAYTLLESTSLTADQATAEVTALKSTLTITAPTKDNTSGKYFRLSTPNRGSRYLTNNGAGTTMTGTALGTGDNQVWQLEGRDDGSFDIKSVYDGSYITMSDPIKAGAKPDNGWTFETTSTSGLFIIKNGSNQVHQSNSGTYNIINWGSGTNKTDDGCLYKIEEVDGFAPTIRYLVVYDQNAKTWLANNSKTIEDHAADIITSLNTCMSNSHIDGRFELAGIMEDAGTYASTQTGLNCGTSLAVKQKKVETRADMVCVLIEHDNSDAVTGSSNPAATTGYADEAICCVRCSQAVAGMVAAHETSHVLGAGHSLAMADPGTAPAVGCERTDSKGVAYSTLLSDVNPNHLLMLSGPGNYAYDGGPEMGSETENNAGTVRKYWNTVAAFSEANASYTLSSTTISAAAAGVSDQQITVAPSGASFNISEDCDWIEAYTEVESKSGTTHETNGTAGTDPIHITVSANTSDEARTAEVVIYASGYNPATITVTQEAASSVKMPTMPTTTLKSTEITSEGWYIFEYQKPTDKFCSAGQFLAGYETEPTWSSASFIPLLNAQTMTNANFGQSLFYLSNNTSSAGNGYNVYMQSPTGHYLDGTTSLGSSVREGNAVHMGYETSGSDAGQRNVYIRTGANGSNLAAMTINNVNSFGGTSYSTNLAFFHVAKVVPTDCGVTPWKVTITGDTQADVLRNDTQISYTGEGNVGFGKVYNNGTFFIDSEITPTKTNFSAPAVYGKVVTISVNATAKTVTVAYDDDTAISSVDVPEGYYYIRNKSDNAFDMCHPYIVDNGSTMKLSEDNSASTAVWHITRTATTDNTSGYKYVIQNRSSNNYWVSGPACPLGTSSTAWYNINKTDNGYQFCGRTDGNMGNNNPVYPTSATAFARAADQALSYWDLVPVDDDITYTIDKTTGSLWNGATENASYNSIWKSTATPQLTFGCGANNMAWNSNNIDMYSGLATSSTYTVTPPSGYRIKAYSFTFTNNNHTTGLTLTMDGTTYTTSSTAQTVSAENKKLDTMSFTLAGTNNKPVTLTDFTVTIEPAVEEKPEMSTDGDVHWYYIVNAASNDGTSYCAGKAIYADANDSYKMKFGTKTYNANYIWSFWEKDGKIAIKSYGGKYFGTAGSGTGSSTQFCAQDAANYIYTINDAYNFFTIKDDATELHAQASNTVIVRWAAASGNASLWKFVEADVSESEATIASTTVQQGRVTTGIGNKDLPILRSTLNVTGLSGSVDLKGVKGTVVATKLSDVTAVKVYKASNARELVVDALQGESVTWRESNATLLGTGTVASDGTYNVTLDKTEALAPGTHYLWIALDIADNATEGNTVDATISAYTVGTTDIAEASGNPANVATIFLSEGTVLMPKDKGVDKTNGSTYFRIPAITQVTKNGKPRLVTLTDDRKEHNSDLPSHCYLVGQYSDDLGKTWSEPKVVAGTAETGGDYGHGDASLVTNRDNGEITGIMVSSGTYGHGFFAGTADEPARWRTVTSKDGGETWSTPKDFTDDLYGSKAPSHTNWLSGFSGSGAALQMRDGTLVSSFVNRETNDGTTTQNFYLFMSKDGGTSWYVSGTSGTTAADEPKTLERNNGDLSISVRASGYNYHNVTSDRGETWKNAAQTRFTSGISGNACDGDYMVWCSSLEGNQVADGVGNIALQTCPNSSSRQNLSIALSTDEGETFESVKTICPSGSAYSSCTVLPDGTLGVYYEENGIFGGYTMRFVRFSLDWASNGKYKFTAEHPFKPIASTKAAEFGFTQQTSTVTVSGKATADEIATYVDTKSDENITSLDLTNANISSLEEVRSTLVDKDNVSKNLLIYTKPGTETTDVENVVVGDKCSSLKITDGYAFHAPMAFTATVAEYARTMSSQWGTLCLPYDIVADHENAPYDLYTISKNSGSELILTRVDDGVVEAGTPLIVYRNAKETGVDMNSSNVKVVTGGAEGENSLVGCLEDTPITNGYYIASDAFWNAANISGGVTVPAFRAYINHSGDARSLTIRVAGGEVTGIEALNSMIDGTATYYDANGHQLKQAKQGINIVKTADGKTHKVILK